MLKALIWQTMTGVVLAAAFWVLQGRVAGYSALLGALATVLPNAFLALRLAMSRRDGTADAILRAAWLGEAGKLALTVAIFVAVFAGVRPLEPLPLLIVFIVTQLMILSGLLMRDEQQEKELSSEDGE